MCEKFRDDCFITHGHDRGSFILSKALPNALDPQALFSIPLKHRNVVVVTYIQLSALALRELCACGVEYFVSSAHRRGAEKSLRDTEKNILGHY